jgi:hypothetical protein
MAKKPSKATTARTGSKRAGKPVTSGNARAKTAAGTPTPEELDIRDRLKLGPRRPAGPPLVGDTLEKVAIRALRDEVVPEATDPKKPKSRR